jgi:hypothetical protein
MGNKFLLILLILIIVVFVVLAVWGAGNNAQKSPPRTSPRPGAPTCGNKQQSQGDPCVDANSFNDPQSHHPSFLDHLNGLLGSFGPKLTPAQMQPTFPLVPAGGKPSPILTLTAAHYSILISSDSHQFRQAKFATKGCAHLVYTPPVGTPPSLKNPQDSDKSTNRNEISFTIVQAGGELTIDRRSSPCTVTLE